MRLNPQSTAQMPFFASPDVLPVLATQVQLEYDKEPWNGMTHKMITRLQRAQHNTVNIYSTY